MISLICSSMRLFGVMRAVPAQDVALSMSRDYFEGRRDVWNRHDSISAASFFSKKKKLGYEELRAGTLTYEYNPEDMVIVISHIFTSSVDTHHISSGN